MIYLVVIEMVMQDVYWSEFFLVWLKVFVGIMFRYFKML